MQVFRRLSSNIFFKIFLAFVALTFVLFGVSGFLLGNPNSWVAKVGSKTIGYKEFSESLRSDRQIVLSSNSGEDAIKYVESKQFKTGVLERLINNHMVDKLSEIYGVYASRELILESVAKDSSFKDEKGQFSYELFESFLRKHGLNEEKYVKAVSREMVAMMVIPSISMVSPVIDNQIVALETFINEKRQADIITISLRNIKSLPRAKKEDLKSFYEQNKQNYIAPEYRKVSYLKFSKQNFSRDLRVSGKEIKKYYEDNIEFYSDPEVRNFYHIVFDDKENAEKFLTEFSKKKTTSNFITLAKKLGNQSQKDVTLNNMTKKDLLPELASAFKLKLNENSKILTSALGSHIFLVTKIKKSKPKPYYKVRKEIKAKLYEGREERIIQEKISQIDDELLVSNSIKDVARKFKLRYSKNPIRITKEGRLPKAVAKLKDFTNNAFILNEGEASKIFYAKDSDGFYALKVEEIIPSRTKTFKEVRVKVKAAFLKQKRFEALVELVKKVEKEVKENPKRIYRIASKYGLRFNRNKSFPRTHYIEFKGQKIPYENEFLTELFNLKVGDVTLAKPQDANSFVIGVLKKIKKPNITPFNIEKQRQAATEQFRNEVMKSFNDYLLQGNEIEVNDKIFNPSQGENK